MTGAFLGYHDRALSCKMELLMRSVDNEDRERLVQPDTLKGVR